MDLRIVDCKLVDFDMIDEEATYSIKRGHNTNVIVEYLNNEGYDRSRISVGILANIVCMLSFVTREI